MSILSKKDKQKLMYMFTVKCIELIPILFNLIIFIIVLIIGTCLGLDLFIICLTIKLVIIGNVKKHNINNSNKTN